MVPRNESVPLEGEFNCWTREFDLPDVLLTVCETRQTGLLRFVSAEAEKTLFIRRGCIVFAKSSSTDDRLGEYLLRRGELSLKHLRSVAGQVKPGKRLGTLLVENGILEPQGLVQAVVGQVRSIILSLFRWTEAWYGFTEQPLPTQETITLTMPTEQLIVEGIHQIDSWRRISRGLGDIDATYRTVSGNETTLKKLDLDTPSLEMLGMLVHPRSVLQICDGFPSSDLDVCRRLWAFRTLGWVEKTSEAAVPFEEPSGIADERSAAADEPPDAPSPVEISEDAQAITFEDAEVFPEIEAEPIPATIVQDTPSKGESPGPEISAAVPSGGGESTGGVSHSASLADLDDFEESSPAEVSSPVATDGDGGSTESDASGDAEKPVVSMEDTDLEGLGLILGEKGSD